MVHSPAGILSRGGLAPQAYHKCTNTRLSKTTAWRPLPVRAHDRLRWLLAAIDVSYIPKTN